MKVPWLGADVGPWPVRRNIPGLVAAVTMLVLYACRPGWSMPFEPEAEGGRQKAEGRRRKAEGRRQKAEG
ncbi:MAG TPA: hypothetical protein VNA25_01790, partial [Phycisphaerae bacterium]|nr:hypothetical protein [Phycisphaerae bacterium]